MSAPLRIRRDKRARAPLRIRRPPEGPVRRSSEDWELGSEVFFGVVTALLLMGLGVLVDLLRSMGVIQ